MTAVDGLKERAQSGPWWLILIEGIAAVVLGILLLAAPGKTLVALIALVGLFFIVKGVLYFVGLFHDRSQWFAKIIAGALSIFVGIIVVQHPLWASALVPTTVTLMVGVGAIAVGCVGLGQAVSGAGWWYGVLGLLSILIGLPFIFNASATSSVLPVILGVVAIVGGLAAIVMAFRMK